MHYRVEVLGLLLLLVAGGAHAGGPAVSASQVWIRETAPGAALATGYLTLSNQTGRTITLDKITSPDYGEIKLQPGAHPPAIERKSPGLAIAAHASVKLVPDGAHLELLRPVKTLYPGDFITLTLAFSDGSSLTIVAPVRHNPPPS